MHMRGVFDERDPELERERERERERQSWRGSERKRQSWRGSERKRRKWCHPGLASDDAKALARRMLTHKNWF